MDPESDPVSASHQGASCSTPTAVPYCFYKLVIPSPSEAVVSKEAKRGDMGFMPDSVSNLSCHLGQIA